MQPRRSKKSLAAIPMALVWLTACAGWKDQTTAVGTPVPEYGAQSLDGGHVSLAALRGRIVLLNVWSVWCLPRRAEIPIFEQVHQTYRAAGIEVVGVNIDGRADERTVRSFVRTVGLAYAVWLDPDEVVLARFPANGIPASYLIDRDGTLLWERLGLIRRGDPELGKVLDDARARSAERSAAGGRGRRLHRSRSSREPTKRGEEPERSQRTAA